MARESPSRLLKVQHEEARKRLARLEGARMMPQAAELPSVELESPFPHFATNAQWKKFVSVMRVAPSTAVSPSNALGAFEMMPRRLVDLGVLKEDLERTRSKKSGRVIWATSKGSDRERADAFLKSLSMQFDAFTQSMVEYASQISAGTVKLQPGCTLSGALAICHRAGLSGLDGVRFPATQAVFERANGIF